MRHPGTKLSFANRYVSLKNNLLLLSLGSSTEGLPSASHVCNTVNEAKMGWTVAYANNPSHWETEAGELPQV